MKDVPTKQIYILCAMIIALTLSNCGFEPVYGSRSNTPQMTGAQSSVENTLSQVSIGNIPDREGQILRNALIDRFYRTSRPHNPAYMLQIEPLEERLVNLDITETADTTRGQLRLRTTIRLIDNKTGAEVLRRDLRAIASYNILASEFTNRVSEQNTRQNAIEDLARQIELQISLYLKRQK